MKILQIFNQYVFEGGEQNSVDRIFSALSQGNSIQQIRFDSQKWLNDKGRLSLVRQAAAMVWNPVSVKEALKEVSEFKPDVIILHNLFPVGSAYLLWKLTRLGIPVVYFIHNFRPYSVNGYLWANDRVERGGLSLNFFPEIFAGAWQDSRLKTLWYALILWGLHLSGAWRRIDRWVAISSFMKQSFVEAGVSEDKISVLKHSWVISEALCEREVFEESATFIFLGRLTTQKGVDVLLEAWKILDDEGLKVPLSICGEGPMEGEVRKFAENYPQVQFRGFIKGHEKATLLRSGRCLVAPSAWYEPLGLVAYDGFEYAMPVIAARSGGLAECVRHGETGLLVEPSCPKDLARAVRTMVELEDGGVAMGLEGRMWLELTTSPKSWEQEMNQILTGVVEDVRSSG